MRENERDMTRGLLEVKHDKKYKICHLCFSFSKIWEPASKEKRRIIEKFNSIMKEAMNECSF